MTQPAEDFVIVQDHPDLLLYVDSLQKKNAEALSFYPKCVFEREHEKRRIFLGLPNGQPCGYIYVGAPSVDVKCHQVCIQYDARNRLYGASLVVALEDYARAANAFTVTLRCGFDLEANDFWQSLGYQTIAHQQGGARRMRTINVWRKQLQDELFPLIDLGPVRGKIDASQWAKRPKGVDGNRFARGARLQRYRSEIEGITK